VQLLTVAGALATTSTANAQVARGFVVDDYEPSERGSDWFTTESLDLRGTVRPAIGVVTDYASNPLVTFASNQQKVIDSLWLLHAGAAVNFVDRIRLAVDLPFALSMNGHAQTIAGTLHPAPSAGQAIGDLRVAADVRVGGEYGDVATVAVGARVWAPTGVENAYAGDGRWRVEQHVLFAGEAGVFAYGGRLAYVYRGRQQTFAGSQLGGGQFAFSASAGLKLVDKKLIVGPEIFGQTSLDDGFGKRTTPLEGLLGAHYAIVPSVRAGAALGTGFTNAYGSPDVRLIFSLEWFPPYEPPDKDGDGVLDDDDACPTVKGKPNPDRAKNGCPEDAPPDRDHDGVLDKDDACPDEPGVHTSDPKTNGCPPDKDGDGVYDKDDACVDVPGVRTSDPKTNGCPPDTDGDGVLDKDDACPNEPGLKTNDPKTNGCPDQDRDKDGIPNSEDACPDEPGQPDPDPKRNGCPKAFIQNGEIKITDQVKFKTGSAQILPGKDSDDVLQAVYKVLTTHPEVKHVRVEGHTDNRGTAALNKKLSADRAANVVKWLVANGIAKDRLKSQGFGPDRPIADNKTEDGRKNNRRVEFHIE
jgi:outer membrane protein OmpA-like peptidoglycan-associated protein